MHSATFRIYYEDTDSGGVVYYANYLKFAERARTELLRAQGINQSELSSSQGIFFVVKNVKMEIISPARLDDLIEITTKIESLNGASINMLQSISCNGRKIAELEVLVVCVNSSFKPCRIPEEIKGKLF